MSLENRIQTLEREVETLKFWHFAESRKTPQVTAMGVKAEIEFMIYPAESGQQIFMNGGLSRGTIFRYSWEQTSGPLVTIAEANSPICYIIAPTVDVPTALNFALTVTDSSNQTSKADVLVHVKPIKKVAAHPFSNDMIEELKSKKSKK